MEQIYADLIPGGKMPLLHASQYDEGREYRINLTENKQAYTLDGSELLSISVRKGDNTLFTADIANTFSGKSYVDFVSTEQMCAVAGYNFGELTIEKNNTRIGTVNFMLVCEPSPEADFPSDSDIKNLNRRIDNHIDEVLPDMVEDIAPAIVEEVAPSVVREVAPAVIEDVAPPILERLAPSAVEEVAPSIVERLVPAEVEEVAPSVVREVAPPIVEELVPIAVGDNYYNKTQTDAKIAGLIDDTQASASKVYSSEKVEEIADTKADASAVNEALQTKANTKENQGINLYNKNASGVQSGYYINSVGGFDTASYCEVSDYTEVKPLTSYSHRYEDYMGVKSKYFNLYGENKQFLSMVIGSENSGVITVTTTATTRYIKYNVRISNRDTFMLAEGSTLPPFYIDYVSPFYNLDNAVSIPDKMFKKIAIFDGDSIGAGNSVGQTDPTYGQGWAGRIGIPNHMNWHNYCVAGGTITYVDSNRHCISRDIDTIHAQYPNLDYLILEGGTNDADFQTMSGSSIDMTDYSGNYDDTKFCGAVETLFYKALNYYPNSKIGFIIAPKMGYTTSVGFYEGNRRREYFEVIIQACKKWSIPYLDLWNDGQLNPMIPSMYEYGATVEENIARGSLYTDGQHLTAKGYDVITPKIEAFMRSL